MAFKSCKPKYMSTLDYMTHQQHYGNLMGDKQLLDNRFNYGKQLFRKDLYAHYGCVNAIEFSNDGHWMISGGDDKRVMLWNMNKTLTSLSSSYEPVSMKSEHHSNIFCLAINKSQTRLLSAGNDEQVILHDINTRESLDVFLHEEAVYGLSADPKNDNVFATSCDDGRVLIWDIRQSSTDSLELANNSNAYHAVMYNPVEPRFLATANAKLGVCLYDIRKPKSHLIKYGTTILCTSAMSVRFNTVGSQILALRRRLPPVLYNVNAPDEVAEFDNPEYYNSCTMKSACFAGDKDQYVLSGSDDFKLYMWKIPDTCSKKAVKVRKTRFILKGHRSIVNQVRYNYNYGVIASSGVEKIIKLWSSFPFSNVESEDPEELRKVYSHEEYINLVLHSGQFMTHDYSHCSTREDPRMIAFFDSLVQRDIEGWTSDSNEAVNDKEKDYCYTVQSSDDSTSIGSSISSSSSDDDDIDDENKRNTSVSNYNRLIQSNSLVGINTSVLTGINFPNSEQTMVGNVNLDNPVNLSNVSMTENQGEPRLNAPVMPRAESNYTVPISVSRRLFSNFETVNSRILANTEGIVNQIFNRDNATSRLLADRQEPFSFIPRNNQFASNNMRDDGQVSSSIDNNQSDEAIHPSSDRISKLIAHKRRVHQLKLARKSMKVDASGLKKQYKKVKKRLDKNRIKYSSSHKIGFIPLNLDNVNRNDNCVKDKRKLLRKKIAKFNKLPNLNGSSSGSSDEDSVSTNGKSTESLGNDNSANSEISFENKKSYNDITNSLFQNCKNFKKVSNSTKATDTSLQNLTNSSVKKGSLEEKKLNNGTDNKSNDNESPSPCCSHNGINENKSLSIDDELSIMDRNSNNIINGDKSSEHTIHEVNSDKSINNLEITGNKSTNYNLEVNGDKSTHNNNVETNGDKSTDCNNFEVSGAGEKSSGNNSPSLISNSQVGNSLGGDTYNSAFSFPTSSNKANRNYRKRKIEEANDD